MLHVDKGMGIKAINVLSGLLKSDGSEKVFNVCLFVCFFFWGGGEMKYRIVDDN